GAEKMLRGPNWGPFSLGKKSCPKRVGSLYYAQACRRAGEASDTGSCMFEVPRPRQPREKAEVMLTVDIALPDVEELHKLVQDGLAKAFLTYDAIVAGLEEVE